MGSSLASAIVVLAIVLGGCSTPAVEERPARETTAECRLEQIACDWTGSGWLLSDVTLKEAGIDFVVTGDATIVLRNVTLDSDVDLRLHCNCSLVGEGFSIRDSNASGRGLRVVADGRLRLNGLEVAGVPGGITFWFSESAHIRNLTFHCTQSGVRVGPEEDFDLSLDLWNVSGCGEDEEALRIDVPEDRFARVLVTNSTFEGNRGSGIAAEGDGELQLHVIDSKFLHNRRGIELGRLGRTQLTVWRGTFADNGSTDCTAGAAIWARDYGWPAVVRGSSFIGNEPALVTDTQATPWRFDASYNWWGAGTGPSLGQCLPPPAGDAVLGAAMVVPHLMSEP